MMLPRSKFLSTYSCIVGSMDSIRTKCLVQAVSYGGYRHLTSVTNILKNKDGQEVPGR